MYAINSLCFPYVHGLILSIALTSTWLYLQLCTVPPWTQYCSTGLLNTTARMNSQCDTPGVKGLSKVGKVLNSLEQLVVKLYLDPEDRLMSLELCTLQSRVRVFFIF